MLRRRHVLILIGLGASLIFTWLALRGTDIDSIGDALARGDLRWTWAFLAFLSFFCVIKAARWAVLLDGIPEATTTRLLPVILIGYFGTAIMPMQLGEVLRARCANQRLGTPFMTILSSLAVERVFDILGLFLLLAVGMLYDSKPGHTVWYFGALMSFAALGLLVVLIIAVANPKYVHNFCAFIARPLGARFQARIIRHIDAGLAGLVVLKRPSKFLELLLYSVGQWIFMCACVWVSLEAFGLNLPITASLAVLVAAVIGMLLPSGPGYIGTFQLAFTLTLVPIGVAAADALAASLFYQVMLWIPLAIAGALSFRSTDLGLSRFINSDDQAHPG